MSLDRPRKVESRLVGDLPQSAKFGPYIRLRILDDRREGLDPIAAVREPKIRHVNPKFGLSFSAKNASSFNQL